MTTVRQTLENTIAASLNQVSGVPDCRAIVNPASRAEFGDYQANGVMGVAKQLGRNPRQLAEAVCATLETGSLVERYEVAGPGFINITLSRQWLARRAAELLTRPDSLVERVATPETIVVDYSSPNLAKEMHVGHLRGTIIGDSLVRVLDRLGHRVIRQNHVGDWGTQFGMLIAYLEGRGNDSEGARDELSDLETFYRAAKARFDSDPRFAELARANVVKLQGGDAGSLKTWNHFIEESLRHCEAVYARLNILLRREDLRAESFYNNKLEGVIQALDEKGLLSVSDGARCVFLPEFTGKDDRPLPVIVQKSDGGYLYSTTDLAAIEYRAGTLAADRVLYVVDVRQSLHFQQIFTVARRAGMAPESCRLEHVAYGTMMGKDGRPFKTRSGDTVKLIDLLDEAASRAFELVSTKNPSLDETQRREIAETVGIGAVKYADLSKNRTSDYVFDWDSMLSFDGNTAPYLLYAYTRIRSVLRRRDDAGVDQSAEIVVEADEERALLMKIVQFPEVLDVVSADYLPSHLCSYLYELAVLFMRFYEACPILKAEPQLRASRLALATVTANTLREGLGLLGLATLEQM